ncbi:MAG: LysR family transcriptional regulator [Burkholderiales bacterium]|nr:LysR family transcriptional regulator [Burkholderiales bacterium]
MRLRRLDLNLLVALDALLATRSVTTAASRLHVTQPSMSGSLARLREHFGDRLLTQVGRRMQLTPLGEMLVEPVRETLQQVEATVSLRPDFDPATAKRRFSVCASEATVLALLVEVLREIEQQAPGVSVELLPAEPSRMGQMLDARELDFLFSGENFLLPSHPHTLALRDDFVCVVWTGNRRVRSKLSIEQYLALGHAITRYGLERRPGFEQYTLERLGIARRVVVSCTTPALLGPLVVGTQRIATLPSRLARQQAGILPLRLLDPPLELPALQIFMQWHRTRERDGATAWFRDLVLTVSRRLGLIT